MYHARNLAIGWTLLMWLGGINLPTDFVLAVVMTAQCEALYKRAQRSPSHTAD